MLVPIGSAGFSGRPPENTRVFRRDEGGVERHGCSAAMAQRQRSTNLAR
ncbi:MAG: hypothetical protein H0T52_00950 [Lautropia sp.]|nr:hypothetical protein [Lautropia sp.]